MISPGMLSRDVSIITAGETTDRYGNTAKVWATATTVVVRGWLGSPIASESTDEGREAQQADYRLFVGPETTITGLNRVSVSSQTFEVIGPPTAIYTPRGASHIEASLRIVEG